MNVLFSLLLLLATLAVSQVRSHTHTSTHRLHSQPRIFAPHRRALATQALVLAGGAMWLDMLLRAVFVLGGGAWATRASSAFLTDVVPEKRRTLAAFPLSLFYLSISMMVFIQTLTPSTPLPLPVPTPPPLSTAPSWRTNSSHLHSSARASKPHASLTIKYLPDTDQPADFLTKFLGKAKRALSLRRATNSGKALP